MNTWVIYVMCGLTVLLLESEGANLLSSKRKLAAKSFEAIEHKIKRRSTQYPQWLYDSYCLYTNGIKSGGRLYFNKAICNKCAMCQKSSCAYMPDSSKNPFHGYEACLVCLSKACPSSDYFDIFPV